MGRDSEKDAWERAAHGRAYKKQPDAQAYLHLPGGHYACNPGNHGNAAFDFAAVEKIAGGINPPAVLRPFNVQVFFQRALNEAGNIDVRFLCRFVKPRGEGNVAADGAGVMFAAVFGQVNIDP